MTEEKEEKHIPRKRIKTAFRKYCSARPADHLPLKKWLGETDAVDAEDIKSWRKGKKTAKLCRQRERINVKKQKK